MKLFITLTSQYNSWEGSEAACRQSWENIFDRQRYWEELTRDDDRIGADAYLTAIEAHALGGAHAHCILNIPRQLNTEWKYNEEKKRLECRITDTEFIAAVNEAWKIGAVDILVCSSLDDAHGYLTKEVGKQGHCESAVERYRRGWSETDDDRFLQDDCKKIFRQYFGAGRKLIRYSQNLKSAPASQQPLDSKDDQLSVDNKKDTPLIIPRRMVFSSWFVLKTGTIKSTTLEGQILIGLWERTHPPPALIDEDKEVSNDKV